jgi:xylulose-5-phosphate/fructose-6-phosphate phosphoketolase
MDKIDAYFRAANYLSVGQIYLMDNPLLKRPLEISDIKPRLLGHFGTTPGLNFIYVHLNQIINKYQIDTIFLAGPGHGGPALIANTYLEGSYTELYPNITQDEEGLKKLFKQFSFPGGIPSHASCETPGSIHEGGELGYVLCHAYGAIFDNPDLIAVAVVGDGEAETGPLAASWQCNKFVNPLTDGAVLPILHLNGYKIANPTILARIDEEELLEMFNGLGYSPIMVSTSHEEMSKALETQVLKIKEIQKKAKEGLNTTSIKWPMIILKTPKGWTGPKIIDGKIVEGSFRSHQVPLTNLNNPKNLKLLEEWLKSYKPHELFDEKGALIKDLQELAPQGIKRMGLSPYANGGTLLKSLIMPDFREYAFKFLKRGQELEESTKIMGNFLRDIIKKNEINKNFRIFSPDELQSNRLSPVLEATTRAFNGKILEGDENISTSGRVTEILSEHICQGWLEGYLLTGRHGLFSCYEAFIHIIDSMFNQYAKWLKTSKKVPWRRPIASLNYLLTSHVWRQDHNGFSHQDPGFIDVVVNKKPEIVRVYLPPDSNCLLSVTDHCLKSRDFINVIIAGKQPALQYLNMQEAIRHTTRGIGIWKWASNDEMQEPDLVIACAGDVPTLEALAMVELLRKIAPEVLVRFINVVDLMVLHSPNLHPHAISDSEFESLFTKNKPVIFAFHGYPWLIHRLIYKRPNHENFHVHGYNEEGTTTTPFDMTVLNGIDRFHLLENAARRCEKLEKKRGYIFQYVADKLVDHKEFINKWGKDLPEIENWTWTLS